MKNTIGIFDSGRGGLSTLEEIRKVLPNENYFYFGDNKNCPFGEKSQEKLEEICYNIVDFLEYKRNVKVVVIACNTATTKCIKFLRENFPKISFVGTEPAIKLATDGDYKKILVLATPGTVESERTKELVEENKKSGQEIKLVSLKGLADAIENENEEKIDEVLTKVLSNFVNEKFDAVVLGCTHYSFVKEKIQKFFPDAKIIDGNNGIARRLQNVLAEKKLLSEKNIPGKVEYFFSKG